VTPDTPALHEAALEAGDRVVRALEAGDLDAAADALADRARVIETLSAAPPMRPPTAAAVRFRDQDRRLRTVLADLRATLDDARVGTERVAAAQGRYAPAPARPPLLDTAPR